MQITNPRVTSQRYRKPHHELDTLKTDHEWFGLVGFKKRDDMLIQFFYVFVSADSI